MSTSPIRSTSVPSSTWRYTPHEPTYKVAGTRTVAGVEPGGTVTDGDLEGCNIDALISGGHLAAPSTTKKEG
jgi:hypothetical protein